MSDIDEVKARLNIVDIVGERVKLKKAGRNFKARCPFHAEKTPSFIVSPDRQMWHCFGCGRGGDILAFIMEHDHVDFVEALTELAERAGVTLTRRAPDTAEGKLKQKIYEVNHLAGEYYHYLLTKHRVGEKARDYLKHRGISDKSIKTFSLGYSPNDWDGLLKFLLKKGYEEELLETAGLVIKSQAPMTKSQQGRYYDRFRGRVMFTLKDHRGQVVGFAGRVLDPEIKEAKYINTSETPVYIKSRVLYGLDVTREAIQKANEAIVMEGEFDVISSFQAGIPNVVAIKGSAMTEDHARLLRRFTERLIFSLDSDIAGDSAARRGIEIAEAAGFDMRVATMPTGKDPDEAARENPGLLKKALAAAVPIYDYFLTSALSRFDAATAFGKKKIAEELFPVLVKIGNPVVRGHYIRGLAGKLDVAEAMVAEGVEKVKEKTYAPVATGKEELSGPTGLTRREKLERYLLSLLLQANTQELFADFSENFHLTDISSPAVRRILELLKDYLAAHSVFLVKDFADSLPKELILTLDEAYLWDMADIVDDTRLVSREWDKTGCELSKIKLRARIAELTKLLHDRSRDSDKTDGESEKELKYLSSELAKLEKTA